uniref:dephospho-CoA kinase n=1 Tax=Vaginimicrobium propionicum TaxID=1871034 RepID=UPI0009704971|nr:dephospho-CoA kinase [Vaginimicrobium propionicum]
MIIGLTGGIASGKSVVAKRFASLGAHIVDADVLARRVVENGTSGFERIVKRFSRSVIGSDGEIDRKWLADVVFNDDEARADLNAIVHPEVKAASLAALNEIPSDEVAIEVIPLLVETGQQDAFDLLIVVDLPVEMQLERLMKRNGYSLHEAKARLAAQASREQRLAVADVVIDNSGALEDTLARVDEVWNQIVQMRSPRS